MPFMHSYRHNYDCGIRYDCRPNDTSALPAVRQEEFRPD